MEMENKAGKKILDKIKAIDINEVKNGRIYRVNNANRFLSYLTPIIIVVGLYMTFTQLDFSSSVTYLRIVLLALLIIVYVLSQIPTLLYKVEIRDDRIIFKNFTISMDAIKELRISDTKPNFVSGIRQQLSIVTNDNIEYVIILNILDNQYKFIKQICYFSKLKTIKIYENEYTLGE